MHRVNDLKSLLSPVDPGNPALIDIIAKKIHQMGRITFADYMEMVLYNPLYGYYSSSHDNIGVSGDFITSSTLSPVFGALIARWIVHKYNEMGLPKRFDIVEMGAGKGFLCASIMNTLRCEHPSIYESAHYSLIDIARKTELAYDLYSEFEDRITIHESLDALDNNSIFGCFVSNELPDAFPVHLIASENGAIKEVFVLHNENGFYEEADEPSTPLLESRLSNYGIILPDGYRTEVNLKIDSWIHKLLEKLAKGSILTIDYGYTADQYYSPARSRGTLMCYYRHTYNEEPYKRIGHQDITAHVDFTALMQIGESKGLITDNYTTQRDFLLSLDAEALILTHPEYRRSLHALIDAEGLGAFKVLIQNK